MNFGQAVRICRNNKGWTRSRLAEETEGAISISYLSLLESGKRDDPSLTVMHTISKALNIPLSIMMFLASEEDDLGDLDQDLKDKISSATLQLMKDSA